MRSEGEFLIQSNTKVTNCGGKDKKRKGGSNGGHIQLSQLLAGTEPNKLGFWGVKAEPVG